MLWSFNTVLHVVMTPNHKIILLLFHNYNFATVMICNVNIWYVGYLICDLKWGCNPQVEDCWYRWGNNIMICCRRLHHHNTQMFPYIQSTFASWNLKWYPTECFRFSHRTTWNPWTYSEVSATLTDALFPLLAVYWIRLWLCWSSYRRMPRSTRTKTDTPILMRLSFV